MDDVTGAATASGWQTNRFPPIEILDPEQRTALDGL